MRVLTQPAADIQAAAPYGGYRRAQLLF